MSSPMNRGLPVAPPGTPPAEGRAIPPELQAKMDALKAQNPEVGAALQAGMERLRKGGPGSMGVLDGMKDMALMQMLLEFTTQFDEFRTFTTNAMLDIRRTVGDTDRPQSVIARLDRLEQKLNLISSALASQ